MTVPTITARGFPKLDLPIRPPYPPMEAKRVDEVPASGKWLFEPKWDGFRAIVFRSGDTVAVQSKAGQPLGRYFPEIVEAFLSLKHKDFVIDGELVIPIEGRLSFDDLSLRLHPAESRVRKLAAEMPSRYFAFDLLYWKGKRPELVCEVEYDYFSQGRFRHGSKFLRWRPDKKPQQCTMAQVLPARPPRGKGLSSLIG